MAGSNMKNDVYKGIWNGTEVVFDRNFRGHRFSLEECEALCHGEMIEVHGLVQNGTRYAVEGGLVRSKYKGVGQDFESVKFKVDHTVNYNPNYSFENRERKFSVEVPKYAEENVDYLDYSKAESLVEDDSVVVGSYLDATMRAETYPTVIQVAPVGKKALFIPVFELLSEEKLAAAAAKAQPLF